MKLRIGIDAINIRGGGGVTHLIELLKHFPNDNDLGIDKVLIWATKKTLDQIPDKPFLIKYHYPYFEKSLFHRAYFQIFKLSKILKNNNCNVLFVPGGSFFGSFSPIVSMSQNLLPFDFQEIKRYNLKQALKLLILRITQTITFWKSDGIIFLTNYAKNTVLKSFFSLKGKYIVIPHGITERFHCKPKSQKNLNEVNENNPIRILYVSIIDLYKHQWHVIEAISILKKRGYHIVLDLVGPSYPQALIKLEKAINTFDPYKKFINYFGTIHYNEINEFYHQADIGIFASSCENMPIILLEKMASGLPIACSNKGPMPEVLLDGGLYFDPESPHEIAFTIERLYNSVEIRKQLANKNYDISKKYSWEFTSYETFKFLVQFGN
jgi:glycosyltransferase involved in cell wall biosynthesis